MKTKQDNTSFYFFAVLAGTFMLWIILIRPLTLPADKMPFIFVKDPAHNAHSQKLQYGLLTGGAIVTAMIFMIPVIINDKKNDKAMRLLWDNRDNIMHEDYIKLMDKLKYNVLFKGNSKEVIADLNKLLKKYEGRDLIEEQYGLKKGTV